MDVYLTTIYAYRQTRPVKSMFRRLAVELCLGLKFTVSHKLTHTPTVEDSPLAFAHVDFRKSLLTDSHLYRKMARRLGRDGLRIFF